MFLKGRFLLYGWILHTVVGHVQELHTFLNHITDFSYIFHALGMRVLIAQTLEAKHIQFCLCHYRETGVRGFHLKHVRNSKGSSSESSSNASVCKLQNLWTNWISGNSRFLHLFQYAVVSFKTPKTVKRTYTPWGGNACACLECMIEDLLLWLN